MRYKAVNESIFFDSKSTKYLKEKFERFHFPLQATIELTCNCNLKCVHCYARPGIKSSDMTTDEVKTIIDKLYDNDTLNIAFTGGEIFTRNDFKEIYLYAKRKGMVVALLSNITLLDEDMIEFLKEYPPISFDTSIYGLTHSTYENVTKIKGSYNRFMRSLHLLRDSGLPYKVKFIALKENFSDIDNIYDFEAEHNVNITIFTDITKACGEKYPLEHRLSPDQIYYIWLKYLDISSYFTQKDSYVSKEPTSRWDSHYLYPCNVGYQTVFINHEGKMQPCMSLYYHQFDLLHGEFCDGWKMINDIINKKCDIDYKCYNCKSLEYCNHCTAKFILPSEDKIEIDVYECKIAKMMKKYVENHNNKNFK